MSKSKKEHTLPGAVFVYEEVDGDSTYLIASRTLRETAGADDARYVGKYYLGTVSKVDMRVRTRKVAR